MTQPFAFCFKPDVTMARPYSTSAGAVCALMHAAACLLVRMHACSRLQLHLHGHLQPPAAGSQLHKQQLYARQLLTFG